MNANNSLYPPEDKNSLKKARLKEEGYVYSLDETNLLRGNIIDLIIKSSLNDLPMNDCLLLWTSLFELWTLWSKSAYNNIYSSLIYEFDEGVDIEYISKELVRSEEEMNNIIKDTIDTFSVHWLLATEIYYQLWVSLLKVYNKINKLKDKMKELSIRSSLN